MTSKISNDYQLLQLTREEISFKKELLEKIDKSDKTIKSELASLNNTMSNIGTAIQQSVGVLAMLVNQGQRKECRNSTESTGTRATSNSERSDIIHTVSVQTHQISGIYFMKTRRRTSQKIKTYYTFKYFIFEKFTWITLVLICFKLVLYKKSFISLLTLKTNLFKIFNIYLSY